MMADENNNETPKVDNAGGTPTPTLASTEAADNQSTAAGDPSQPAEREGRGGRRERGDRGGRGRGRGGRDDRRGGRGQRRMMAKS